VADPRESIVQALRAVAQPMVGQVPAGLMGLFELAKTGDPAQAAAASQAIEEAFAYTPTDEGAISALGKVGEGVEWAGEQLSSLPGADTAKQGWEDFTISNPAAAAMVLGGVETLNKPGKAAKGAKAAAKAGALRNKQFPELTTRYPEIGAPIQMVDKKTGKEFLAKGESPESKAFMAERRKVAKDMETKGYEPMFDPEQRYDANVANYPDDRTTRELAVPKTQKTTDAWREKVQTPEARARIQEALRTAEEVGGGDRWYLMGQLEDAYIKELGPDLGPARFKEDFADAMAATTGGAAPEGNFLMAQYHNFMREKGELPPSETYNLPSPIGGRFAKGNIDMANKTLGPEGRGLDPAGQPKRYNFSRNFLGDTRGSTIDERMTNLIMPGTNAPPGDSYFAFEELLNELKPGAGRDIQDVGWLGYKNMGEIAKGKTPTPGKPMIETVNDSIERTARLTGQTPEEVLKGMIRRTQPMYAVGGGLGVASMVDALRGGQEDPSQL
jgi:hypothetical protein